MRAGVDPETAARQLAYIQATARREQRVVRESWKRPAKIDNEGSDARGRILGRDRRGHQSNDRERNRKSKGENRGPSHRRDGHCTSRSVRLLCP